ncbi:MAG: nucleoside hydrolase [Prevotella sp.]|nr:nucleoside hydrolase [Prevotella sp.]
MKHSLRLLCASCMGIAALLICGMGLFASCSDDDKPSTKGQDDVPLIILDTDICASTDDLFAMEMLYRYADQGRCRLLGVVVDREGEGHAAFADLMNTFFGYPHLPIGQVRDGIKDAVIWTDYRKVMDVKDDDGKAMFHRTVADYDTLPDGYLLYRRLLAAQPDKSVSIISIGYVTCLAQLLESGADEYSSLNGVELVRQKVKGIYIMGGSFGPQKEPEYNFAQGVKFAQTFFRLWPTDVDMMFSPGEVGDKVCYSQEQVIADVSWTDCHPVKQVYMMDGYDDSGQRMWDPLAVIQAIEGDEAFNLSERGTVSIDANAVTTFTPSPSGNCRYQVPGDDAWVKGKLKLIRQMNMMH